MGCDIHPHYEIQQPDGSWQFYDYRAPYETSRDEDGPNYNYDGLFGDPLYIGRSYRFFAFLADVRNGRGFAGCDTGDTVAPMDEPRGVPEDASAEYLEAVECWGGDGHSHSFFTGAELRDADWEQLTTERRYISLQDYPRFKEQGNLDGLYSCGDAYGQHIIKLTTADADTLIAQAAPESLAKDIRYYVNVQYTQPMKTELAVYLTEWLPAVLKLHEDPEKVRMSFFFDN